MREIARRLVPGVGWRTGVVDEGSPNGGSQPGAPIWHGPFSFNYDDDGLVSGIAFYTPTVGDLLLNVWVLVNEAWNGETPTGDVGTFVGASAGLFGAVEDDGRRALDMTRAASVNYNGDGNTSSESEANTLLIRGASAGSVAYALVPRLITAAHPYKFTVSKTGEVPGSEFNGPPGASQGQADIYLCTATPSAT